MATLKNTRLVLVLFSFFVALSLASPTTVESPKPTTTTDPLNCSSKFSGDYYGLGVRLGIYFTWFTSWLANTFIKEEISGALDANSIFLFALLISIFKGTLVVGSDKLAYIDGLILMQLCAGYLFGILSLWGYRTTHYNKEGPNAVRHYGRIGTHCRLGLATAISVYGIWFWAYGIRYDLGHGLARVTDDKGDPRPPECYPVYVFFFAKLNVLGGIRIFYIVTTISTTLYYGTMLVAALAERIRHLTQVISKEKGHAKRETFKYETGLTKAELDTLFNINRVFNLIWICFSAAMVEMTLIWNHVTQVLGPNGNISYPAQLLPMLIGVLGFLRVCWLLFKRWWYPEEDNCDENEAAPEKQDGSSRSPPDTSQVGLGLLTSPTAYSPSPTAVNGQDYYNGNERRRSLVKRYLVAYLPWLSQSDFWKNPKGHRSLQNSLEENGNHYRDSSLTAVRTSYKPGEEADLHVRSMPSSTETSPMIDMKSPTSVNESPIMSYKKL